MFQNSNRNSKELFKWALKNYFVKVACRVQIRKKTFCQNSDKVG